MTIFHQPRRLRAQQIAPLCFALLALAACGSTSSSKRDTLDPETNLHDVFIAATGPLEDLNLRRDEIPPPLKRAAQNPYAIPPRFQCSTLQKEIAELNGLLSADMDAADPTLLVAYQESDAADGSFNPQLPNVPKMPDSATLANKGVDLAHDQALGFVRDQTDILPFRKLIRTLTGAEQHARRVTEAKQAGQLRRAFLKGLAQAKYGSKCPPVPLTLEANAGHVVKE